MSKMKTMAAMGALLLGAAYAAEPSGNQNSDEGIFSTNVSDSLKVWVSDNTRATATDASSILQVGSANTSDSPLALEFTVLTNLEHWDLSLQAKNRGKLLRADGVPLKTDAQGHDGSLGDGGTLYVSLEKFEEGNINNVSPGGLDIDVSSLVSSLASAVFSETEFQSEGRVRAVFEVKAGMVGSKIIAPPGTYTETVTLTLIKNDP